MHRRTALTVTGALALTLAAGSAAMAANLGILDRGSGVDVGDLSPVDSTTQISTPGTTDDSIPGVDELGSGTDADEHRRPRRGRSRRSSPATTTGSPVTPTTTTAS